VVWREESTILVDLYLHRALGDVAPDRDRIDVAVGVGGVDRHSSGEPVENQLRIGCGRRSSTIGRDERAEEVQGALDHVVAIAHVLQSVEVASESA